MRGEGTVAEAGREDTQGDENLGSVVAAAISRVASASSVSGAAIASGAVAWDQAGEKDRSSSAAASGARTEVIIDMVIPRGVGAPCARANIPERGARY